MPENPKPERKKKGEAKTPSAEKLDQLIEEATVDAYNEEEQIGGFYAMLEDHLAMPFQTEILGVEATVERIELTDEGQIIAVCRRGKIRQRIPILDLPLPDPPPEGSEWIDAFRRWVGGG